MVFFGFEHSTTFSQDYLTISSTIFQLLTNLVTKDYSELKMDTNYQNYAQMQQRTNYCTKTTSISAKKKTRIVDYCRHFVHMKNGRFQQNYSVLSPD